MLFSKKPGRVDKMAGAWHNGAMKNKKTLNYFLLISAALTLNACAMNPVDDEFALDPAPQAVPAAQVNTEMATIDSQLIKLDSQIANAQGRLKAYQVKKGKKGENNLGLIMSTQAEIDNFEVQKSGLTSRKQDLNSDLVIE